MEASSRSINRQLLTMTWPFLLVAVCLVALAVFSLNVMSSVRAYIGGESYWSKGQKDAVFYLSRYAHTGTPAIFKQYQDAIAFPRSLERARLALEQRVPQLEVARTALIQGGVYPGDVRNVIWVFLTFRYVGYFDQAVQYWTAGDGYVNQLAQVGDALHAEFAAGAPRPQRIEQLSARIWQLNAVIAPLSRAFSDVLSASFRRIAALLLGAELLAAVLLMFLSVWHARRLIFQRMASEDALRRSEARAKTTLGSIGEAVVSTGASGHIEFINAAAERLNNCVAADCIGKPLHEVFALVNEQDWCEVDLVGPEPAGQLAEDVRRNLVLVCDDGRQIVVQAVTSTMRDASGVRTGAVLVLRNMMREREYTASLAWQATHDGLTGLLNRAEFERRLFAALAARDPVHGLQSVSALMFLDLDKFKVVNDTCGHAAGDAMLREAAARFQACMREGDTLARLGGDEFGVLLGQCHLDNIQQVAERLRTSLNDFTFHWETQPFTTSVSVGIVALDGTDMDADEAMRFADIACYIAKERGRDRVQFADPEDQDLSRRATEISWGRRLNEALEQGRFCLYAQPIQTTSGPAGGLLHAELLVRMVEAGGNVIEASAFIPAAERYGLMSAIDRWVVKTAFVTLAKGGGRGNVQYAINLSGASIGDERFLEFLREQFAHTHVVPESICFEITETTAVANLASAARFIRELIGMGCKFALDDFGAGMSSFAYLKHLPTDYLKIDGSFIKDMLNDPLNRDMVAAINDIGHSMGRKTIAEYVESEAILTALRDMGVDFVQGYYIGRPALWNEQHALFSS